MVRSFICLLLMVNHVFAMSGLDVMTLVQKESQKNTRKAVVHMKIYDDQDRERVRFFNYWTKYKLSREDSLIKFFDLKMLRERLF